MRVLHFDCFSGISGDMTLGALIDAGVDAASVKAALDSLGLPITFKAEKVRKGGFAATHVTVAAPHEHKHRHLHHVEEIVHAGRLTDRQRELALRIFRRLAEAEAAAHGLPLEKVHFHEVGALDSIADIVGAAVALDLLGAAHVTCTPVPTGSGLVECAHGQMPIPAPGTAELLRGIPLRPSSIKAELTTPTGAAILATVVDEFTDAPALTIERIGHGAGTMDFDEQPNILRVLVGPAATASGFAGGVQSDTVWVLETNLDDVPGEVVGHCFDLLFAAGAVDVFTTPIQMKKNRPGVLLTVLAPEPAVPAVEDVLFRETGTLGVRRHPAQRHKLHRKACTVETAFGPIEGKLGWREGDEPHFTPEYESCARAARDRGAPLREVYREAELAYTGEETNHGDTEDTEEARREE